MRMVPGGEYFAAGMAGGRRGGQAAGATAWVEPDPQPGRRWQRCRRWWRRPSSVFEVDEPGDEDRRPARVDRHRVAPLFSRVIWCCGWYRRCLRARVVLE